MSTIREKLAALDKKVFVWLKKIYLAVSFGAGKDIIKPKKTRWMFIDILNRLDYYVLNFLRRLDAKVLFQGRQIPTPEGMVRSHSERKIVNFFMKHGIRYEYEKPLVLEQITIRPDFYLPDYNVYVEFWGMADSDGEYQKTMRLKKMLFQKHQIPLISIYPRHIQKLERNFPALFLKATGKELPL